MHGLEYQGHRKLQDFRRMSIYLAISITRLELRHAREIHMDLKVMMGKTHELERVSKVANPMQNLIHVASSYVFTITTTAGRVNSRCDVP